MNLQFPRDFECYNPVRKLAAALNSRDWAAIVVLRLFVELGYQVEVHGGSGVFAKSEWETFSRQTQVPGVSSDDLLAALLRSEVLIPSGEEWVCPIFRIPNMTLDKDYIPALDKGRAVQAYENKRKSITGSTLSFIQQLPKECWQFGSAPALLPDQMKRAVMLIKTIDGALKLKDRDPDSFTPGMVQSAHRVAQDYTDDKLNVILKRFWVNRSALGMRRNTEEILNHFDDIVWRLMPDDGYLKWDKKSQ